MKPIANFAVVVGGVGLLVLPFMGTGGEAIPNWECTTYDSHEYGVIHYDIIPTIEVTAPDGKHETWGLGACVGSHQMVEPD